MKLIYTCVLFVLSLNSFPLLAFTWSEPVTLSAPWQDADLDSLAVSRNGGSVATWQRFDGDYIRIQASHYSGLSNTWSSISDVATVSPANRNAELPQVAVDASGNAFAVWRRFDGSNWRIQVSRYNATTKKWTEPLINAFQLSPLGFDADIPQVAASDNGRAVVAWQIYDGSNWRIQAARYNGSSWFVKVLSSLGQDAFAPSVSLDPVGNGFAVWYQWDGNNWRIQASRYSVLLDDWFSVILSEAGYNSFNPKVGLDVQSNAFAAWQLTNTSQVTDLRTTWTIQAAFYNNATSSWDPVIKDLANDVDVGSSSRYPFVHVAVNRNGKALFTWYTYFNNALFVQATDYDGSTWSSWTPPVPTILSEAIQPLKVTDWPEPQISIDDNNNGIATWVAYDSIGNKRIQASYYNGVSWLDPAAVPTVSEAGQDADMPQVGMDPAGNGFIIWKRADGTNKSTLPSGILRVQATQHRVS